ncbi:hypothetical protein [Oligosphaera ethanolica]|uniref:DUF4034 domain-containing protein n=1 Tax=Oligosphaera ethanolica TaxID=760260 RepID=A0AAE3VK70_9BACT|nr:hypothetical protein [Oligosphaera ethanolica]MDQ0291634.1 hypothetical protein [Oligosphaera ethanolica]
MKKLASSILIFIVAFFILGAALSAIQGRMNAIRYNERLTDDDPLENAPPLVAFTSVALGGFRGLVADYLWLRSSKMQDEGNYFEMVQLADWIVKLQPRFTGSHAFLAWNMAYNVSVTFTSFEDRWRWVKRGIELIRDEALEYNPGDPELFRQLGWIYQHKLGKDLDDANRYYKTEFAKEMIRLFGDFYGEWDELIKAPENEQKLRAALGGKNDVWGILASHGYKDFADFERHFRELAVIPPEVAAELRELGSERIVEASLRRRWMVMKYRLLPDWLKKLNAKYGDLDWRLAEAHAIYWAERGREKWTDDKDTFKRLSCDRMIFQSLAAAFETGRLVYLKDIQHLEMTPNIHIIDAVNKSYQDAWALYDENTIGGAYGNFLVNAVVTLYKFGEKKKAAEILALGNTYERYGTRFAKPLDEFVLKELADDMEAASYPVAQGTVQSYLMNAYYQLAIDEDEVAEGYLTIAQQLYDRYRKFVTGTEKRRALPPWKQMQITSLEMTKQRIPAPMAKRLEERLPKAGEKFIPEAGEIAAPVVQ